jgi:hypothetical protein
MFGTLRSDSTHHFFRNACTKSGSLRFSQFSGCWLIIICKTTLYYSINEWVFSYLHCYMFKVCNNGPRMAVMTRGNADGHYSHPRAIITDREHITGWFCLFIYLWVLTFPLEDSSEFGNFVITLICKNTGKFFEMLEKKNPNMNSYSYWLINGYFHIGAVICSRSVIVL